MLDLDFIISLFKSLGYKNKIDIKRLNSMTNKNYLVFCDDNMYVIRIAGAMSQNLVIRENESFNSSLMSKIGINVNTIYFDAKTGVKITKYLPQALTFNHQSIKEEKALKLISKRVKELHRSKVNFNNEFNVFVEFEKYLNLLKNKNSFFDSTPLINDILFIFSYIKSYFSSQIIELAPCHNDLVPENILINENNKENKSDIYIIDWEYSGMNNPIFDIAAFFLESKLSISEQNIFLHSYFEENINIETIKKEIIYYQFTQDILWFIWTLIKEENNEYFGEYGNNRLQRAINTLDIIKRKYHQ